MCDYSPYQNQPKRFHFLCFSRLPMFTKNMQKSIIELQKYRHPFNYRLFSFVLVLVTAKLTLIKEHSRFFCLRQAEWPESRTPWDDLFLKAREYFNFFRPEKISKRRRNTYKQT